jgi:hypothetical protein
MRKGLLLIAFGLTLLCAWVEASLFLTPQNHVGESLRFVRQALDAGSAARMQRYFPEGYLFNYLMYGLASSSLEEVTYALTHTDDAEARAPFPEQLQPRYGVFYVAWTTLLRGHAIGLGARGEKARFVRDCEALAAAFQTNASPFLPAYEQGAWPVDSVVAISALALHDRLYPPHYAEVIARWTAKAKLRLDKRTGLLPHRVDWQTGALLEGARGSSQSIIARLLPEAVPEFGDNQYLRFRNQFVFSRLGLPGIREYPRDVLGEGDVDSGPLIFGVSMSATVVALGAAIAQGDSALALPLWQVCETFGLPLTIGGARRYGFGLVPVGDAFIAWALSAKPGVPRVYEPITLAFWRFPVVLLSVLLLAPLWYFALGRRRG